ncbi:hypothetical protein G9F73_007265 [Clostridium estertheticum]|uniref:hypothetical protein n=1 Tax=Clostridium estertheticum TaxID=238834 RepID=UPI0013EE5DC3|nr:hypothetical protein [Clostridium estertheticum]MBZ9607614.1 hypothetical protein [Clostridium estertheticum]
MVCYSCKNEFTNINGLKFCPYCGEKIEEKIDLEDEQITNKNNNRDKEKTVGADKKEEKHQETIAMPAITEENIKKDKRDKVFAYFKKTFVHRKVIIPIISLLVVTSVAVFAYTVFIVKPVDEVKIKDDLLGKVVTLPKGTVIKISKNDMKSFKINSRNTYKGKDDIKVDLTLNNGAIEAKTSLALVYNDEGKNQWKISPKIIVESVNSLKPLVGMNEKKFWVGLKKLSINIADIPKVLSGQDVTNLGMVSRTPDLENKKEEILVTASIDSGLLVSTGKIKCNLVFENETWRIDNIEENSAEGSKLVLSPTFSDEKVIETIKEQGVGETVSYSSFFGGKGFAINDRFTKSINISDKKFDVQNGTLIVNAKRESIVGEIKLVLSTNYTFSISFANISFLNRSKTTVDSGTINNVPTEIIVPSITNAEIEGSNLFFWWSNNHKITAKEAKTFKSNEILSKKGLDNIKYVYGSITYKDEKKNENKNVSFVALYFLVYDADKGYNWKLDKLVGEDSPNYKAYKNQ